MRAAAQLLHRPAGIRHPVDVARALLAIQAQEPRAARLAFRARGRRFLAADVDRARNEERSLLRAWLMRETAHLVATEDAGWMLPLFEAGIGERSRRRLVQLGMGLTQQERALTDVRRWLGDGPLPRSQLYARLADRGYEVGTPHVYHLLAIITSASFACLGPDRGREQTLVLADDWIGPLRAPPREDSLAELARRYLAAYAPATDRDLTRWAGLPLRDCRIGFERISDEITEVRIGKKVAFLPKGRRRRPASPVVRLLGAFDNYNLGYRSRDFAVDPEHVPQIIPGGGMVRPTVTVDGRFVGTWASKRAGRRLNVSIEPFGKLDPAWAKAIVAEVDDIGRFEGVVATLTEA